MPKHFLSLDITSDDTSKVFNFKKKWMDHIIDGIYELRLKGDVKGEFQISVPHYLDRNDYDSNDSRLPQSWIMNFAESMCHILSLDLENSKTETFFRKTNNHLIVYLCVSAVPQVAASFEHIPESIRHSTDSKLLKLFRSKLHDAFRESAQIIADDHYYLRHNLKNLYDKVEKTLCPAAVTEFLGDNKISERLSQDISLSVKQRHDYWDYPGSWRSDAHWSRSVYSIEVRPKNTASETLATDLDLKTKSIRSKY